jgi:Fic-DOC domain mobile mystery protein B
MNLDYPTDATPLSEEEKEGLLIRLITTRKELDRWEQENIADAYIWLSRKRKVDLLDEHFLRELHKRMFGKVWKWAGEFRRSGKNIGVEWTRIAVDLLILLADVKFWIDNNTYPAEEIACRFHHRLVYIHLFPNGNGRHARIMTDLLLEKQFKMKPFSWGSNELTTENKVRKAYIKALKAADENKYRLLLEFARK